MLTIGACGSTTTNIMHEQVTAAAMLTACDDPVEAHNVPPYRFPIPAQLVRHHNCLGVDDMLVVMWPLPPSRVNVAAAELLMLMYVDYENNPPADIILSATFIKQDSFTEDGITVQTAFYELTSTSKIIESKESE